MPIYSQTLTGPGGRPVAGDYEITTTEPGKRLTLQVVAGPARPTGEYVLAEATSGTTLRFILDLQPAGLMKLLAPIITRTTQSETAQLTTLKSVLEYT